MLTTELINKLNLIAFEGWEYHKLPVENLGNGEGDQAEEKLSLLTPSLPIQSELLEDKRVLDSARPTLLPL